MRLTKNEIEDTLWDVVIVGTGMGSSVLGHALVQKGLRVLFCEQGLSFFEQKMSILKGDFTEHFSWGMKGAQDRQNVLRHSSRLSIPIYNIDRKDRINLMLPWLGSGTGGSTLLYGMALERFFPSDFEPLLKHPRAGNNNLINWPINWREMEPYYEAAERLFRVRGEADPLKTNQTFNYEESPPFPLGETNQQIKNSLEKDKLHPYRLPLACEFKPGCKGCQGYVCLSDCKNDAARIALKPAVKNFGASIIGDCYVTRIEANHERVTAVYALWKGEFTKIQGKMFILGAGAIGSAALLLNSTSDIWPNGLANRSGMVGKNLMRHLVDLYIFRSLKSSGGVSAKALAFNDYYDSSDLPMGTVQSFGDMPPADVMVADMESKLGFSGQGFQRNLMAGFQRNLMAGFRKPLIKFFEFLIGEKPVFASVLEDLPYLENRVLIRQGHTAIKYSLFEYEQNRIQVARQKLKKHFAPFRPLLIARAAHNEMLAHACGTCRFGEDPQISVLDRWNRTHDLENLYVVDASFFPSSGGTNPALTIAANALRIADHLSRSFLPKSKI